MSSLVAHTVLAFALGAAFAPARAQERIESAGSAPPGQWITRGGSGSRSGTSLSKPIRSEPEEAWSVTLRGEIESEPLVWADDLFVAVREHEHRRALQILDVATGRTRLHQSLPASTPLEPAIWDDHVAVRPEKERVDVYRIRGQRLFLVHTVRATTSISPPLIVDGELYLRVDDRLERHDLDAREPRWTARVPGGFRGSPSVRGAGVYGLWYDSAGNAHLGVRARTDGRSLSDAIAGHHGGAVPSLGEPSEITILEREVVFRFPRPVEATSGKELTFGRLQRKGERLLEVAGNLSSFQTAPTEWTGGWLALDDTREPRWLAATRVGKELRMAILSDADSHPELLESTSPASRTGDVVYFAGIAADLVTGHVLWKREPPRFRPVPARGHLFVVEGAKTLTALRESPRALTEATLVARRRASELQAETAEGFALLAYQSVRLGDKELVGRLIDEAVERGAVGRTLESARAGLSSLAGRRSTIVDPRRLEAVRAEEALLATRPESELCRLAHDTNDRALQRAYLRAALAIAPEHEDSIRAVRSLVPPDAPRTEGIDAVSWLDFLDGLATTPVEFLHPSATEKGPCLEQLRSETMRWRRDLAGYRSERLFIIAPPGAPGAVSRCLEVGELVCDILEEIFAGFDAKGDTIDVEPLTLLLYESRDEYLSESRAATSGPELALGWTAGHFSPSENLSRMYVPEDDVLRERLLGVYAHELTHHWLATRSPFASRHSSATLPFWIVEGFASLVEEFRMDPSARTWRAENPRAESLDIVANAPVEDLLPWADVLSKNHIEFEQLNRDPHTTVSLSWRIGRLADQSEVQLFYAQAATICHYLFNSSYENGVRLMKFVGDWYAGNERGLEIQTAFGLEPEELGKRAREYAIETVAGD